MFGWRMCLLKEVSVEECWCLSKNVGVGVENVFVEECWC